MKDSPKGCAVRVSPRVVQSSVHSRSRHRSWHLQHKCRKRLSHQKRTLQQYIICPWLSENAKRWPSGAKGRSNALVTVGDPLGPVGPSAERTAPGSHRGCHRLKMSQEACRGHRDCERAPRRSADSLSKHVARFGYLQQKCRKRRALQKRTSAMHGRYYWDSENAKRWPGGAKGAASARWLLGDPLGPATEIGRFVNWRALGSGKCVRPSGNIKWNTRDCLWLLQTAYLIVGHGRVTKDRAPPRAAGFRSGRSGRSTFLDWALDNVSRWFASVWIGVESVRPVCEGPLSRRPTRERVSTADT